MLCEPRDQESNLCQIHEELEAEAEELKSRKDRIEVRNRVIKLLEIKETDKKKIHLKVSTVNTLMQSPSQRLCLGLKI